MSMIISEAFRKLEFLSEDTFELNDDGIDELKSFIDSDEEDDTVKVIDPEAESEDEIKDSYLGKVILDCAVCHSKIYKDADEVTIEDGEELANTSEECPYCYTTDGYKVIGQVSNFTPNDVKVEVEGEDDADVEEGLVPTPSVSVSIGEGAGKNRKPKQSRKGLKESFGYDYVELYCDDCDEEWTDDLGGVESEDELYDIVGNGSVTCPECGSTNVGISNIEGADDDYDDDYDDYDESFKSRREATEEGLIPTPSVSLSIGEAGNMDNYVDRRPNAGSIGNDLFNVYETGLNGRKCIAQGVNIDKANKLRKQGSRDGFISVYNVNKDPYADKKESSNESISESFDEIALTTDGQKITVKSEPAEQSFGEETIAPVSQEVEDEIVANNEGEADVDVDEFSEENFDELGEGYLKEVYDNVKSYKTTGVTSKGNSIKLEGVITFTSGKQKQTQFVFEAKDITKKGKARFIGENKQICRGSKAFTLTGSIKSGKFLAESFNYNYRANGSKRVYGTIKRK